MWFIVFVTAWFALGYLGARQIHKEIDDGFAILMMFFGPVAAVIGTCIWVNNHKTWDGKRMLNKFFHIKDR